MLSFILGALLGGTVGFFAFSLCTAVKMGDNITKGYND